MDLPNDTPAGGETARVAGSDSDALSAKNPADTGEKGTGAPFRAASAPTHVSGRDSAGRRNILEGAGRILALPRVLWTTTRNSDHDSNQDFGSGNSRAASSPDAQGRTKMIKRNLPQIGAVASVAMLSLALHSCGQKPAPAENAETKAKATSSAVQAMRVTRVAQRNLSDEIIATGRLVVREEAAVGSELPGYRVSAVFVDEGDWVKQGQALARLDDTLLKAQIAQAEATLATQKANVTFKESQLARAESLAAEGAFAKEQVEQRRMESASARASLMASQAAVDEMKVRQSRMTLRAPVSGSVLQRSIRPGDISGSAASPYFRIARDGLIELDAELPDSKLSLVHEGDKATVQLATGETIAGKVRFISPRVDANTSLGRARIVMPFDKALRPGSFAQATFSGLASDAMTVSAGAIRYESGGPAVMVVDDNNKVHRVPVKLGERTGDFVQLIEGPAAGSRVLAIGAAFTLDGDVIEPVEEGVASGATAPGSK